MTKLVLILALATVALAQQNPPQLHRAIAKLSSPSGSDITGNVTFTQLPNGTVQVEGMVLGLAQGQYGFHVHEKGDITGGCISTGGHFNPEHKNHGHPNDLDRHVGDLGNLEFDENKTGKVDIIDHKISLFGPNCILGRAVVLHEKADDFGVGGHPDSRKTGNAGGRVACGVIGILDPVYGWKSNEASKSSIVAAVLIPISALLLFMN